MMYAILLLGIGFGMNDLWQRVLEDHIFDKSNEWYVIGPTWRENFADFVTRKFTFLQHHVLVWSA